MAAFAPIPVVDGLPLPAKKFLMVEMMPGGRAVDPEISSATPGYTSSPGTSAGGSGPSGTNACAGLLGASVAWAPPRGDASASPDAKEFRAGSLAWAGPAVREVWGVWGRMARALPHEEPPGGGVDGIRSGPRKEANWLCDRGAGAASRARGDPLRRVTTASRTTPARTPAASRTPSRGRRGPRPRTHRRSAAPCRRRRRARPARGPAAP